MTTLREAAQQALEALEQSETTVPHEYLGFGLRRHEAVRKHEEAITALRTAILYPGTEYEQGFIDGMSEQARRSVDRAVNAMAKSMEERK